MAKVYVNNHDVKTSESDLNRAPTHQSTVDTTCPSGERGMLVEFMGVSGCGKSTLVHELARQLSHDGYEVDVQFREHFPSRAQHFLHRVLRLRLAVSSALIRPALSSTVWKAINAHVKTSLRSRVSLMKNALYIIALRERSAKFNGITLIHQGYYQILLSIAKAEAQNNPDEMYSALVKAVSPPDKLVIVSAETKELDKRLSRRSEQEQQRAGHLGSVATIATVQELCSQLAESLQANGVSAITVDNGGESTLQQSVSTLKEALLGSHR